MIDRLIDGVDAFAARWRVPLAVLSVAWFVLTCMANAGFIDLPAFRLLTGLPGVMLAGIWNAIWWGWLYPRAAARRAARSVGRERGHG